jgi:hypothetical protein
MWETTFPRNSHAGLGRPFYERNILTSMKHVRKVPTQSGVAISRKCCFPHGPSLQWVLQMHRHAIPSFMTPKRRLGKAERTVRNVSSTHFSRAWVLKRGLRTVEKCVEKMFRTVCLDFPNLRLGTQFMPQTKIWYGGTNDEIRIFERLFNGS